MNNLIKLISVFLLLAISFQINAQNTAEIKFEESEYDFGVIEEGNGSVEHTFNFTNTGSAPLIISNAKASCGCTTPNWSKDPIAPGQKGSITARYNPLNRPGPFRKSITITANTSKPSTVLYIKGSVNPRPKSPADHFPIKIGATRFRYRSMHMGKVLTNQPASKSFEIFNDSDKPVSIADTFDVPAYITIKVEPAIIEPQKTGKMEITYDAKAKNDLGFASDQIKLYTNEASENVKTLNVLANIQEYFAPLTATQLEKAPHLLIENSTLDIGILTQGTSKQGEFVLQNTGKETLKIRKIESNCSCITTTLDSQEIEPGSSTTLRFVFNPENRRGMQTKSIQIFSNDPKAPTQRMIVKGKID